METPESMVARNVAVLREQRALTVRALSARLGELGRPILPSGITKIESQTRGVGVGDLVALAIALRVNPNRLLIGIDEPFAEIALTPALADLQVLVWPWLRGEGPLWSTYPREGNAAEIAAAEDDFHRHAQEAYQRFRDDHTAIRAAQGLLRTLREYVDQQQGFGVPTAAKTTPAQLRTALALLAAAVDDLIGDDDGER